MQRLLLLAAASLWCAPSFAQTADWAPPTSGDKIDTGTPSAFAHVSSMALLYDNGPIQTGTGNGAGGANTSVIGSTYGANTFGFPQNAASAIYVADDFTVPAGGWTITDIETFGYQTNGNATTSSFTGLYMQIWNGRPGDAGSTVVYGDLTTNRLASSTFTGIYRVASNALTGATRPIYRNVATVNTFLPAGTYWVQWGSTGSLASGPWVVPVTVTGTTPPPGNARTFNGGTWSDILDGGTTTTPGTIPTALAFVVNGTAGTPTGPTLFLSSSTVGFGTVSVGQTASQTVTLTNSGTAATTISSITTGGAPFTVNTSGTSLTLAPGASTTFTVSYAPTAFGASTGSVSIASNAPGSPATIALTGSGIITSTLEAGTTAGAPTYNRATTLGTGATGSCTIASGIEDGVGVAYQTISFQVTTAGAYTITTSYVGNTSDYDGWIALYRDSFSPTDACLNQIAFDDDFVLPGQTRAILGSQIANVTLTPGTYVLVVTGFDAASTGAYTGTIAGPDLIAFPVAGEAGPRDAQASLVAAPNPARASAQVRLTADVTQPVVVSVFDVTGREVATVYRGQVVAGQTLDVTLAAASLPAGVYVVRAAGETFVRTQRLTVVR